MSQPQTSLELPQGILTQHAMLVAWGLSAQEMGLIEVFEQVEIKQKTRVHSPQRKVIEFFVAILGGLPHLQDISRSAHPLDQDLAVARAWKQTGWADYSGVSRTLQKLSSEEVGAIQRTLDGWIAPIIAKEVALALQQQGYVVYDGDLTGRPVSNNSTTYPDVAYGYMGDRVQLGYQAAMVSFHSPTYGRLWLNSRQHPGDTVSVTQLQDMVRMAEQRTGVRPRRRVELVTKRLDELESAWREAEMRASESEERLEAARAEMTDVERSLAHWRRVAFQLNADYVREGRDPTPYCQLSRAKRKVQTYEKRLPRRQKDVLVAERRFQRHARQADALQEEWTRLQYHYQELLSDNAANPAPVRAIWRMDAGFASQANLLWLIEMGYDVYSKGASVHLLQKLLDKLPDDATWERVGKNAEMVSWANSTLDDHFSYPLNIGLLRYHTGDSQRHAVLLHFGDEPVTQNQPQWFRTYNSRQTIEAGIKEGKNVFQMHHLKVRSAPALQLQEYLACLAANFVRLAAHWFAQQQQNLSAIAIHSVQQMVQVVANTSARVWLQGNVWLLKFTEQSLYAGQSLMIRLGQGAFQLPLPFFSFQNSHF
jgi:hypothetical protein